MRFSLQFWGVHKCLVFSVCLVWRSCTCLSNLALTRGSPWFYTSLPSSLSSWSHHIFVLFGVCFTFTCILSLLLILSLFALAQIVPDKVFTEQSTGGKEGIFTSLSRRSLTPPWVSFRSPPPCDGKCEWWSLNLWMRVWGFQNVGGSEESLTAVSPKTLCCCDGLTAKSSPVTEMPSAPGSLCRNP